MSNPRSTGCRRAAAFAAGFVVLTHALAAGAVDLRDWGRKFPASQRFVVLTQFGSQAVLDKETQLVWQRTPFSVASTWGAAQISCATIGLGGRRGWRLPSVHELSSLTIFGTSVGALSLPAGHPFLNVMAGRFWTATTRRFTAGEHSPFVYVIDFGSGGEIGSVRTDLGFLGHTWCVRGGGPISEL